MRLTNIEIVNISHDIYAFIMKSNRHIPVFIKSTAEWHHEVYYPLTQILHVQVMRFKKASLYTTWLNWKHNGGIPDTVSVWFITLCENKQVGTLHFTERVKHEDQSTKRKIWGIHKNKK
jgi:hypothetical protein